MKDISLLSLEEIAVAVLKESKQKTTFADLYKKVAELKGYDDEEKKGHIAQFYTDITASGDFLYCGEDLWDLKSNEPLSALDSEFYSEHAAIEGEGEEEEKPKKAAKKRSPKKYIDEMEDETKDEEKESEDEEYEKVPGDDAEEETDEDEDPEKEADHEKDIDSDLDDDKASEETPEEDEDFDEDKYNSLMDQYEDKY
jgi:DNA-directed RNA polymerase subunit delta